MRVRRLPTEGIAGRRHRAGYWDCIWEQAACGSRQMFAHIILWHASALTVFDMQTYLWRGNNGRNRSVGAGQEALGEGKTR